MLFHSLLERESGVYVVQVSFRLAGLLDEDAFEQAWNHLIRRHDVLRTAFVWEHLETPLQVVGRQAALPFERLDLSSASGSWSNGDLSDFLTSDRQRGFDPAMAPLMRVTLLREDNTLHRVVWTYHHLILDGWSLPILMSEWGAAYQTAIGSTLPEQPTTSLKYKDYLAWLKSQDKRASLEYWQNYLRGFRGPTPLGVDQKPDLPQSQGQTLTAPVAHLCKHLSTETTERLKEMAKQERLTLSTLVQGAWAIVLSRYSDTDDVVFGVARSGRPPALPLFDQRVGMFINTLPIRAKLDDNQSVTAWLQSLQAMQQEQQSFEHASLTDVHEASEVPRNLPLMESVVVFENYPLGSMSPQAEQSLAIKDVEVQEQTNFPLSIFAVAREQLELRLLYATSRFHEKTIAQLSTHLVEVLERIAPRQSELGEADQDILLRHLFPPQQTHSAHTGESYCLDDLTCTPQQIAEQARQHPAKIAAIFGEQQIDYQTLETQANVFSEMLYEQGAKPGQAIGTLLNRSLDILISILGIWKAGCHYVPLDPTHPQAKLSQVIEDAGLEMLIVQQQTSELVDSGLVVQLIPVSGIKRTEQEKTEETENGLISSSISSVSSCSKKTAYQKADTAYLIYTSGTTGQPKGVPISHGNLANLIHSMAERTNFGSQRRLLAVTTLAFDIAALELLMPLCCGGTVVIAEEETARDGEQLLTALSRFQIDTIQATPATWHMCCSAGLKDYLLEREASQESPFTILCGGEAIEMNLAKELVETGAEVWNVYGPTETTIWSGALRLSAGHIAEECVPVGGPLANTSFHVLDSKLRAVPEGMIGELCIGGAGLSAGYYNNRELTRSRFVEINPSDAALLSESSQTLRVYRTGDLVRARDDGTFDFLGRSDYQVKLRGYRIELGEIETALQSYPEVEQAVVVVQGEGTPAARLLAAVRFSKTDTTAGEELQSRLRSYLTDRLPTYMLPTIFCPLDSLPLTPNGKIDRQAILTILTRESAHTVKPAHEPRTLLEQKLAAIWQQLLKIDKVGLHDNFFEMGGHSLLLLKAQNQVREQLEVTVPLVDFFRYPTLHALANHLSSTTPKTTLASRVPALEAGKARMKQRLLQK